jgi:Holliday junction resolvase RusA-like endonuclease
MCESCPEMASGKPVQTHAPIVLVVRGTPAPKGSLRAVVNKHTGRAMMLPGGSKSNEERLGSWVACVREAAANAIGNRDVPPFVGVPLVVDIEFRLARPAGHWLKPTKKRPTVELDPRAPIAPMGKPDADKLLRTTWDALTGIIFDDDARIVDGPPRKRWAKPGEEGATIRIREFLPTDLEPRLATVTPIRVQVATPSPITAYPHDDAKANAFQTELAGKLDAATEKARARDRVRKAIEGTAAAPALHAYGKHATLGDRPPLASDPTIDVDPSDEDDFG